MARPRKDGTPAKRPQRGPIPSNDPPPGYMDPDVPVLTDAVGERVQLREAPGVSECFAMHIAAPRTAFLKFFADGLLPVVGRNYAFVCVEHHDGGPDDTDVHSVSFKLVRIYA